MSAKPFLQSLELGLPHPLTPWRLFPPPFGSGGREHSLAREGLHGGGGSQFRHGDIRVHCGTLCMYVRGASKIKLKKVNKKRTVTVRRLIIFFEYLKASIADLFTLLSSSIHTETKKKSCLHQYKTLKAVAKVRGAIVVLTNANNLKKVFWGFLVVSPLFNHFLGYVYINQRVIWPKKIDSKTFERF
jgi:hypothetical protein